MLQGCVSGGPPPRRIAVPTLLEFQVSGKLAVRNGERGQSLRFNWHQYPQNYAIQVWGPLGQGRVLLYGTGDFMTVERGDDVVAAGRPDEVMLANLGWHLPVKVLNRWIRGEPHPQYVVTDLATDVSGDLEAFSQAGWQVQFSSWQQRATVRTPAKIVASRGTQEATQKITVAVKSFLEM